MGLPVGLPPGSARRHASLCEDWYATKLQIRMPNATWLIEAALDRLNARCIYRRKAAGHARGGGLAVLLRGGAFRGSETPEVNRAAQIECALSVQRMIVRPFAELGDRVGVRGLLLELHFALLLVRMLLLLLISSSPALHTHRNQPVTSLGSDSNVFLTVY